MCCTNMGGRDTRGSREAERVVARHGAVMAPMVTARDRMGRPEPGSSRGGRWLARRRNFRAGGRYDLDCRSWQNAFLSSVRLA